MNVLPSRLRRPARALVQAALDLLYPPLCVACDARLASVSAGDLPLCGPCRRQLAPPPDDLLPTRLAQLPECPTRFEHAGALWIFDAGGVLQALHHTLKYGGRGRVGVTTGRMLGAAWDRAGHPSPDVVVPVPLARSRLLERGYNQSERLAVGMAQVLGVPVAGDALRRARDTRRQTTLSRERRRTNVAGAFTLSDPEAGVAGRRVLLIDDVLTTGATVLAASEPLREAGAIIDLAVLALTRD